MDGNENDREIQTNLERALPFLSVWTTIFCQHPHFSVLK
jgi:hypothetical protein